MLLQSPRDGLHRTDDHAAALAQLMQAKDRALAEME
jgi:hypothetical protein